MTSALRTTRNSRTKILAAGPARIFAAGSNAGQTLAGGSGLHKNETLRDPAVSSPFADAGRTAAAQCSLSAVRSHPAGLTSSGLGWSRCETVIPRAMSNRG